MLHPLDLPEIRSSIGVYLGTRDLINCACVSKEWNATFRDIIWHHITLGTPDSPPLPEIKQIQAHSNHIHTMVFNKQLPAEYYEQVNLRRLFSLEIDFNISRSYPIPFLLGMLIESHSSSLKRFQFTGWNTIVSSHTINAIGKCQGLTSLWLSNSILYLDGFKALLVACANIGQATGGEGEDSNEKPMNRTSGLVTLHLEDLMLWECNEDVFSESAPFPHLKHLNIQKMRGIVPKDMLRLLKLCPNLKSLYWRGALTRAKFQVDQWVKDVESGVWSRLTCLDVQGEEFHDEGLSCVIKSLPLPLEKFMVKATGFGPMAFDALITTERHYNHIQELELSGCLDVESSMIQKIMAKMPALEYFSANRLFATDIVDTSGVDQNGDNDGQEWICKNLRTLKLCIDMGATSDPSTLEYKERQRQVYSRLSELELLETLEVGRDLVILGLKAEVRRLENGASAGLGQLLSLKRLKEVSINQGESLTLKDIELMVVKKVDDGLEP